MNLRVLRPADGIMMKLVKYNLLDPNSTTGTGETDTTVELPHNHSLVTKNESSTTDLQPNN